MPPVRMQAAMASGITVTSNPDPAELENLGVMRWPTWGCEVSTFPWSYDEQETCLLLEAEPPWLPAPLVSPMGPPVVVVSPGWPVAA